MSIEEPLLPLTREMLEMREKLSYSVTETRKAIEKATMDHVVGTVDETSMFELITEGGEFLKQISPSLERCDEYIKRLKQDINALESIRKRARLFMLTCKPESVANWSKLLLKTNMILRLVDAEKRQQQQSSATSSAATATSNATTAVDDEDDDDEVQIIEPTSTSASTTVGEVNADAAAPSSLPKAANTARVVRQTKTAAPSERCGEKLYDDMCEIRLFLQCNGDLSNLADKMSKYNE
eukprot:scaffold3192_cov83-Skeletonema_marinoi.AAC.3